MSGDALAARIAATNLANHAHDCTTDRFTTTEATEQERIILDALDALAAQVEQLRNQHQWDEYNINQWRKQVEQLREKNEKLSKLIVEAEADFRDRKKALTAQVEQLRERNRTLEELIRDPRVPFAVQDLAARAALSADANSTVTTGEDWRIPDRGSDSYSTKSADRDA